jgi:uncharacterized LabA/DUF88 family protein
MPENLGRIAIFVDVQNIYYTTKQTFNRSFDYRSFWRQLSEQGEIVNAFAYAIESNNDGQRKFQDALRHIGFEVKLKPYIQRQDGSAKGDWDVGITIDVMDQASNVDTVILLSGDGDFELLMTTIKQRHNVTTHVVGVEALTANLLIRSVDKFVPIGREMLT